jgi:hypothetical protein
MSRQVVGDQISLMLGGAVDGIRADLFGKIKHLPPAFICWLSRIIQMLIYSSDIRVYPNSVSGPSPNLQLPI